MWYYSLGCPLQQSKILTNAFNLKVYGVNFAFWGNETKSRNRQLGFGTSLRLSVVVLPHLGHRGRSIQSSSPHVIKHSNHITNKHGLQSKFCHQPSNYNLVSQNLLVRGREGTVPWSNTFHWDYSLAFWLNSFVSVGTADVNLPGSNPLTDTLTDSCT